VRVILESAVDDDLQRRRGERAREVFQRLYTIDHVVEKLYQSLRECAQ
jgi:hypothetical protein